MNRELVVSVLYDIALVIGGEVSVQPLLTKTLQRILYHTSFPTGLVFLDPPGDDGAATLTTRLDAAVGDFELNQRVGEEITLAAELLRGPTAVVDTPELLQSLPATGRAYGVCLRMPLDHAGVILLLAPRQPSTQLPLTQVFQPVMANLAKAITLCRHNDLYTAGLTAERDEARQSLKESEEKFRSITTVAQDAIVMVDDKGSLAYWNPAAERIFGYRAEEVLGKEMHPLIAPERYADSFLKGFEQFRSSGKGPIIGKTLEIEGRRSDGSEFPVELSISALNLNGHWHAVGLLRDITERKRNELALQHSESRLKEAQRIALLGNWELDLVNDALTWSDEVYHIFEIEPGTFNATYEAFLETVHPDDREMVDRTYQSAVANQSDYEVVHRLLLSEGRVKYVNERGQISYSDDGRPLLSFGTVQDITRQREDELALERANRTLKTLSGCNSILVRARDEARLLDDICRLIVETGGYRSAWVAFAEDEGEERLRPVASAGIERDYLEALDLTLSANSTALGPAARAFSSGQPQLVQDVTADSDYLAQRAEVVRRGVAATIALPLLSDGVSFGVLKVYAAEREAFNSNEVALLKELAEDLAFGIATLRTRVERRRLEAAEHENAARLQRALLGTIQAVALTVEKRDPYTAGHQQNVVRLAVAIAQELGWPADKVEGVRLGATIHDIGKIYIPAEILNRPGELSELEYNIIKNHPQVGYEIVKDVEFPWPVAQIILQHHERLDGSGYPNQLSGEQIIPEARVLAVADVVEAMSSHRPYRPAYGVEAGLAEITKHRGSQFDSDAVDACLRVFHENNFSF